MNIFGGVPAPSTAAPAPLPEVETYNITVEKESL